MAPVDGFDSLPLSLCNAFLPSVAQAQAVVNALDEEDFDLLLRCVDLVVLSQTFSEGGLACALDLPGAVAEQMTDLLVKLEILSSDEIDGIRLVLVDMRDLPLILLRLNEGRRTVWRSAA